MHHQEQHTMILAAEYPDGSQEWLCPTCGRRFLMKWPPNYSRSILEEGDTSAIHSGEVSGLALDESADPAEAAFPRAEDYPGYNMPTDNLPEAENLPLDDQSGALDMPIEADDPSLEPFRVWIENHVE